MFGRMTVVFFIAVLSWLLGGMQILTGLERQLLDKTLAQRIKAKQKSEKLYTFVFSRIEMEELVWLKRKEFKFRGEEYDVCKVKWLPSDSVKLICYKDEPEQKFRNKLKNLTEQGKKNRMHNYGVCFQLFYSVYLEPEKFSLILTHLDHDSVQNFYAYNSNILSQILHIETPPPEG